MHKKEFSFHHHNLGDYLSKVLTGMIHKDVRLYYVHMPNLQVKLARASMPSSRRECAEILDNPYYSKVILPRIAGYHKLDQQQALVEPSAQHLASVIWHNRLCKVRKIAHRIVAGT